MEFGAKLTQYEDSQRALVLVMMCFAQVVQHLAIQFDVAVER